MEVILTKNRILPKKPGLEKQRKNRVSPKKPGFRGRKDSENASKYHQQTDDQERDANRGGDQSDGQDQPDYH
jgi:hypothetical protein